jgi:hypothetical protein
VTGDLLKSEGVEAAVDGAEIVLHLTLQGATLGTHSWEDFLADSRRTLPPR